MDFEDLEIIKRDIKKFVEQLELNSRDKITLMDDEKNFFKFLAKHILFFKELYRFDKSKYFLEVLISDIFSYIISIINGEKRYIFLNERSIIENYIRYLMNENHIKENTFDKLKEKIEIADKFILLATEKAINSKWCNWELGLGDAAKYMKNNIALFPITKNNENFQGTEYLTIYPRIEYENGNNKYSDGAYIPEGFYVKFPDRTIYLLRIWLQKIFRK